MEFRSAITALFGRLKQYVTSTWREIGRYNATFSPASGNVYANEVARACIHTLAEHTSKANPRVVGNDTRLQKLLENRPNLYMNAKDFLYKVRTRLEIDNTVFIYINRDELGRCIGLYPIPTCFSEAVEVGGMLYIKFRLPDGSSVTASWEDLAVLRKHYNESDIAGESSGAIYTSLDLLNTTNQGMANAIKSTSNLRGILQSKKAMLTNDDAKKMRDAFVADNMTMDNTSGIGTIDSMTTFTPLNMQPVIANYKSVEELRMNIYRWFGVNEKAVTSQLTGDDWEAFYEAQIEPFLIALGLELTNKIYTERQRGYGNQIIYESNRMQHMTMASKLALVQMVDRKAMTPNEWRQVMNLAPLPGGDELQSWQNPKETKPTEGSSTDDKQGKSV